ncbi:MAG: hypothetical protein C5B55_11895 [Blastocatellia bacterium]|nr:MAG: hypothetical protein C5B55_11895 [Blastocatellia bacterium]
MSLKRIFPLILVMLYVTTSVVAQEAKPKPEHFGATAYSLQRGARMVNVDVRIKAYTDDATTKQLAGALVEGGQDALTKALEKQDEIGGIRLTGHVGFYDFKLIRSRKTPTGRRIVLVCDRPLQFAEVYSGSRSSDYTLGILILDLKKNEKGKEVGTGTLYYAAKVKIKNGKTIQIEHFQIDPIRLVNVKKYND